MRRIIFFIIIFAVIIGIVGFWYWQRNSYSKDILKLEILGPSETQLAKEVEYNVKYKNNGSVRLEQVKLIFQYPDNSIIGDGKDSWQEISLEDIYPGEEKTISFKARLLGKDGEMKTAKAELSYKPKNLTAQYVSDTTLTTAIKDVPLTFEFDLPSKIESDKDLSFSLNYFSNVDYPLSNLSVQLQYPSGFEFVDSSPASLDKINWDIGLLNKSDGGRIQITGNISGEVQEDKIFQAKIGTWINGNFVILKEATKGIEIIKPSLYLMQEINDNPQYAALPGDWLHYKISFKNIGDGALTNLSLVNKLEGDAFDFQTLKSDLGNYSSGDNSVVFDWRRISELQYLAPTDEGSVDFLIKLKDDLGNVNNPTVVNKVFIGQIEDDFVTKIRSKLEIVQKGYYQDEVFGNSGPIPPQVGEKTTYTIMWQVKNYYSDVKDVKVKAVLPQGVELTGKIFPEDSASKFAFDSQSREIVWTVGDVSRGAGLLSPGSNISFQIVFTPDVSQRGKTAELITGANITGEDGWTGTILESGASDITTSLPDDSTITDSMGVVK